MHACSAVLPLSSAFASTGIVAGFVIMVVVAAANAYTCDLLLWQAYKTGMHDYETLSYAVGGGIWKVRRQMQTLLSVHASNISGSRGIAQSLTRHTAEQHVVLHVVTRSWIALMMSPCTPHMGQQQQQQCMA